MGRIARVVVPGLAHHVTQRGNRRSAIFFEDADRFGYLNLVRHYARFYEIEIWAYCLMTNHVHFVVVPKFEDGLSLAFRDTHTSYATGINRRRRLSGHLWQGRFFSCPLDDAHLWAALRYVERNPVRVGLVTRAEDYQWSSAAAHCSKCHDTLLSQSFPPAGSIENWSEWLQVEDTTHTEAFRARTHTGRPCGDESFVERLQTLLGRPLQLERPWPKKRYIDAGTMELI